jgi:hypothetical protein
MDQTANRIVPPVSVARRAIPWFLLVAVLLLGAVLCLTLGQRIEPFFAGV